MQTSGGKGSPLPLLSTEWQGRMGMARTHFNLGIVISSIFGGLGRSHLKNSSPQKLSKVLLSYKGDSVIKADIIRSIEVPLGLAHQEATLQVEQILSLIKNHLSLDDPVMISGFGQWPVRYKETRDGCG